MTTCEWKSKDGPGYIARTCEEEEANVLHQRAAERRWQEKTASAMARPRRILPGEPCMGPLVMDHHGYRWVQHEPMTIGEALAQELPPEHEEDEILLDGAWIAISLARRAVEGGLVLTRKLLDLGYARSWTWEVA